MMKRLPRIAVVGLFQTGKSLVVNGVLGGACLPVGSSGLRTTPCPITCSFGALDRVEVICNDGRRILGSLAQVFSTTQNNELLYQPKVIEAYLNRPILCDMILVDTPGFDFADGDDSSAAEAVTRSDASLLVVTQQLPAATRAFDKLVATLKQRPWGLVLNCGKSGPHLEDPNSHASHEVEGWCVEQLSQAGAGSPVFSQRISARCLPHLGQSTAGASKPFSNREERQSDLTCDEASLEQLRDNLRGLGREGLRILLESAEIRLNAFAVDQGVGLERINWKMEQGRFATRVRFDDRSVSVSGEFRLHTIGIGSELVLHKTRSPERWLSDWLSMNIEGRTWPIER